MKKLTLLRVVCKDQSLVSGPGYLVMRQCYRVGRSSRCAYILSNLSVSRYHADLTPHDDCIHVKDLESRNGTFVDGQRIEEAEVKCGQTLSFGSAVFHIIGNDEDSDDGDYSNVSTYIVKAPQKMPTALEQLSDAQRRVLDLLLTGLAEKQVASRLDLSPHTVHNHVKEIYRKMDVNSRSELLALFLTGSKDGPKGAK